jgi:alpha-N-arabinofuranosidase
MILTDKEKMLLTPTYHVFEMYKVHHDATRLPVQLLSPDYEFDGRSIPALSMSASRNEEGTVHVSIVNAHATEAVALDCDLAGIEASTVTGRILTADELDAHNTFDEPERVKPAPFDSVSLQDGKLVGEIPPRAVVVLSLKK